MVNEEGGGTRQLILEIAEQLIAEQGVQGFKLKDIAKRLGIQPPSIFSHFEGRDAIAGEVRDRIFRQIGESLRDDAESGPTEVIKAWARNLANHLYENPAHVRIILFELAQVRSGDPEEQRGMRIYAHGVVAHVGRVLRRGQRAGEFRRVRPDAFLAQLIGGIVTNLCWEGWDAEGNPLEAAKPSRVKREAEDLALGMLLPR